MGLGSGGEGGTLAIAGAGDGLGGSLAPVSGRLASEPAVGCFAGAGGDDGLDGSLAPAAASGRLASEPAVGCFAGAGWVSLGRWVFVSWPELSTGPVFPVFSVLPD